MAHVPIARREVTGMRRSNDGMAAKRAEERLAVTGAVEYPHMGEVPVQTVQSRRIRNSEAVTIAERVYNGS